MASTLGMSLDFPIVASSLAATFASRSALSLKSACRCSSPCKSAMVWWTFTLRRMGLAMPLAHAFAANLTAPA
eukprot:8298706-Alexandrium_andersonii.AAC.1